MPAPGRYYRKGLSFVDAVRMFPDDATAEAWFVKTRWPDGITCPHCGSDNVQTGASHPTMPMRCRSCRKRFSVKTGTVMQGSNLGYQVWALAGYLMSTNLKSVSSMKFHRELAVTQKTAWHLAHRLRETWQREQGFFTGPVEVDETYVGGKRKNMSRAKRKGLKGRGGVGKTIVVGAKDRTTNRIFAQVVPAADGKTLKSFVWQRAVKGAVVYTDEARAYQNLKGFTHETVNHSVGEYVRKMAHTNGIESFWAMLKRGYQGTFHHFSAKHCNRYVGEFAGRHNIRRADTIVMMKHIALGMVGKQLRYRDLIADG